jgi:hypothetical protein
VVPQRTSIATRQSNSMVMNSQPSAPTGLLP